MQLALALFPETEGLDGLIEESMPWLMAWLVLAALFLSAVVVAHAATTIRSRSPVEKLLRRGVR